MRKNNILIVSTIILTSLLYSCKKDKKEESSNLKDCEKNIYGVLKVEYNSAFHDHSILLTPINTALGFEKITKKRFLSDTMHLKPGIYNVSVSALNDKGESIEDSRFEISVSQCVDILKKISFYNYFNISTKKLTSIMAVWETK